MKPKSPPYSGFTLIETLVAIAIVVLIGTISIATFYSAKKAKELGPTADGVVEVLERAKADAIAGKDDQSFGVYFASSSYSYFEGPTYNSSDTKNRISDIFGDLV